MTKSTPFSCLAKNKKHDNNEENEVKGPVLSFRTITWTDLIEKIKANLIDKDMLYWRKICYTVAIVFFLVLFLAFTVAFIVAE